MWEHYGTAGRSLYTIYEAGTEPFQCVSQCVLWHWTRQVTFAGLLRCTTCRDVCKTHWEGLVRFLVSKELANLCATCPQQSVPSAPGRVNDANCGNIAQVYSKILHHRSRHYNRILSNFMHDLFLLDLRMFAVWIFAVMLVICSGTCHLLLRCNFRIDLASRTLPNILDEVSWDTGSGVLELFLHL